MPAERAERSESPTINRTVASEFKHKVFPGVWGRSPQRIAKREVSLCANIGVMDQRLSVAQVGGK